MNASRLSCNWFRRRDGKSATKSYVGSAFKFFPGWLGLWNGRQLEWRKVVGGIEVKGEEIRGSLPQRKPRIIHVADFKLDAESYSRDQASAELCRAGSGSDCRIRLQRVTRETERGRSSNSWRSL